MIIDCINSVMEKVPQATITVVDNASIDHTPIIIQERFPDVEVIVNEANLGFGAACNRAGLGSDSEILVFLNQDSVLLNLPLEDIEESLFQKNTSVLGDWSSTEMANYSHQSAANSHRGESFCTGG